jgi:TolB protein
LTGLLVAGVAALPTAAMASTPKAGTTQAGTTQAGTTQGGTTQGGTTGSGTAHGAAIAGGTSLPTLVAYVRDGDIYASRGAAETRLTTGGGFARPRWSPDGRQLAALKGGQLWVMKADGTQQRRLTTRPAAGPSWSPDGKWIAFASLSCTGGPGVYRIAAAGPAATPQVLFPTGCRTEDLPAEQPASAKQSGTLNDRLRTDDAVAWSPDGSRMAFRGGDCEDVYDSCLTVGTVASGGEKAIAAFGGGSLETSGFAVVPSWRADGAKLAFTAYQKGETSADDQPVHLVEYDTATGKTRTVGGAGDREMTYLDANRGVATGQSGRGSGSWIVIVGLSNGSRTLFHQGSQPSVQPAR